jgi:hypothetical protein
MVYYKKISLIGSKHRKGIVSKYLMEMSQVKGGFMGIKLAAWGREGNIPHFHFYRGISPNKGVPDNAIRSGGCICIKEAAYFIHGRHRDTMRPREIKGLIEFLKMPHVELSKISNWEYILATWNGANPYSVQVDVNTPIPAYTSNMGTIQQN